ncbi:MAG: hypothetical protein WCB26_13075 [Pseudolabrys sp.]
MKAVLLTSHGGPEMLRYGEAPDPTAGLGEVVVDVYAASVNAADSKVRQGGGRYTLNQFPHIFGRDFCVNKITLPRASLAAAGSQD